MDHEFSPEPYDPKPDAWPYPQRSAEPFGEPSANQFRPTQQFPGQQFPGQQYNLPPEPLAHEGGLAYGNPPAAPYGHPHQYVPQHLAVPNQYAPGMYAPGMYAPGPYQQQFMPPQPMQQTVYVNGGRDKGVNHLLHLILTLLTAGLWLPVWIIIAMAKS